MLSVYQASDSSLTHTDTHTHLFAILSRLAPDLAESPITEHLGLTAAGC